MPGLTIDNLDQIAEQADQEFGNFRAKLMVCAGTGCVSAGSLSIRDALKKEIEQRGLGDQVKVVATGCNGFCAHGPICVAQPQGVFYQRLKIRDVKELVEKHFVNDQPVERLMYRADKDAPPIPLEKDIQFFAKQQAIALRNRGLVDPEDIQDAVRRGAYRGLQKVLSENLDAESIIQTVLRSGIRGRGGGGFPTGVKWQSCREAATRRGVTPYVVCNADEGDPGAFMDRSIVEADPHAVIEGMLIGARALGAKEGFVYIRREYPLALRRLQKAIAQAREWGVLGRSVMGTEMQFDVTIHQGAGAFVCGESTALMASMDGRPGEPRAKYVHTVEYGYRDMPTVLNNVETWATIPQIMVNGAEWFASIGTGDVSENPWGGSTGTKVFSLVGNVNNTGLVEVPMGITLREIVFDIGGGIPGGKQFKAVQTGGPSGGCLPESQLDLPVDFDTLTSAGSMMGSGGLIVMDQNTCMVDVAKYFVGFLLDESCGKCTPCREGLTALHQILTRITEGQGGEEDLKLLEEIGAAMRRGSLCALGQTAANPVLSTLRYFREEYEKHIYESKCPAGVCKALITYSIDQKKCTGCVACVKPCPTEAITGEVEKPHVIDQEKCIQCGTCMDACNYDAVMVE
jgi:NADH:ubiquinone oxidoreductase subunit F (NADH-binding)/(2Fe-2S) ferredoxin/Pyruvate/2-oxoacid:ferredoxin oxidoreductase delta subunit